MRISVTTENDIYPIEVADDLELENFKALCEMEVGIPSAEMMVMFNSRPLTDNNKTLKDYGLKDGELVMVVRADAMRRVADRVQQQQQQPRSQSSQPMGASGQDDPAVIRDMLLANPEQLALLRHNNPRLAEALSSGDLAKFASVLHEQQEVRRDKERQRIRMVTADPFDMEAQRMIASEIQQENINANMEAAMEYVPESFGTVHMLYIDCIVNGHHVKAFVDSGAQTTIMSQACAERCNIMRLVDTRWSGIAKGVGTQKIIGRVHMGQIQMEGDFLASSFSILEEQPMDMLLGLDMLKRHQMRIDLKTNKLHIGTTGTETKFLSESELPDCARLTSMSEEDAKNQSERSAKESEDQALAEALAASAKDAAQATGSSSGESKGTTSTTTPAASAQDNFSESDIKEIVQLGFPRDQAISELRRQNGNKTQAIAALFAKSFKM